MLKNLSYKFGMGAMAVLGLVGASSVHAAADADLATGIASTTAIFSDNKSQIILGIVGIFAVTIVVGLVIKLLHYGKRQALGMFGGRRKR